MTGAKKWSWPLGIKMGIICSFSGSYCMVYEKSSQAWLREQMMIPPSAPWPPTSLPSRARGGPHQAGTENPRDSWQPNSSSPSVPGSSWERAGAVTSCGSGIPIFLRHRVSSVQQQPYQELGIRLALGASWNSRERDSGMYRLVRTALERREGNHPHRTILSTKLHITSHRAIKAQDQQGHVLSPAAQF